MSTLAVKVERVRKVESHPNADRLDLIQVLDWFCVTKKGEFKEGDLCVYFPIDSILPDDLETYLFPPESKIVLNKHRIKSIKIRQYISQGMCVPVKDIVKFLSELPYPVSDGKKQMFVGHNCGVEGLDLTEYLGVTKYEPPAAPFQSGFGNVVTSKRKRNPLFKEYTDVENANYHPDALVPGEMIYITEKIHGTNFRAGYLPYEANTWWKKLITWLHLAPKYEFVYGSRRVQLQDRLGGGSNTWYQNAGVMSENVYAEAVRKYDLRKKLKPGEVIYGEIYGDGIQKGYNYGCAPGEHKFVGFDLLVNCHGDGYTGNYEDPHYCWQEMRSRGIPHVPILAVVPYVNASEIRNYYGIGPSFLCPEQKVMEGIVVKPSQDRNDNHMGRVVLKYINPEYLLKDQSEYH